MENVHAVELKGITKRFGHNVANDSIDLYVDRGVIMALLGENGSGKTTLMNMLAGIYAPDEGQIFVDGKEVAIIKKLNQNGMHLFQYYRNQAGIDEKMKESDMDEDDKD